MVHVDISEPIVHIKVIPRIEIATVGANPPFASPAMIVGMVMVPVPISVEPGANDKTGSESDQTERGIEDTRITPQRCRIIFRNIDDLRLCRLDLDRIRFNDDLLLRRILQSTGFESFAAQTLNRSLHIRFLLDKGLSNSRCPIRLLRHHIKDSGIVSNRLDTRIPGLALNETFVHPAPKQ
jgi:hypothetical protein